MSALDLSEYVRSCVEENPFFDDEVPAEPVDRPEQPAESLRSSEEPKRSWDVSADALMESRGHGSPENFGNERKDMSQRTFSFDRYLVESDSLEDHLGEQLHMQTDDRRMLDIGEYLIGCIDSSGYMRVPEQHVADTLGVSLEEVQASLAMIQQFEPVGVGARNLAECIRIQLEEAGRMTPLVRDIVDNRLPDFERRTAAAIARDMGVQLADLSEAMEVIRACNPRPAAQFGTSSRPIWPEVIVRSVGDGTYSVELQDFYLPHLHINEQYRTMAADVRGSGDKADAFLKEKMKEAEGLVESINYRRTTLYKVACCIAEIQAEFFDKGYDYLRPLTMARVAQAADVSESTVSRLVNGNYAQTPRGVFELRFFFHSAAGGGSGAQMSSMSVKRRISDLVQAEDPARPLSDQAIAEELEKQGVSISRRTVNKYRDELGIPARAARKRC